MELALTRKDGHTMMVALTAGAVGLVAAATSVVLLQAPVVWLGLITIGLLVFAGSFLARRPTTYWFTIFLACVPLNITKLFFWSPEDVTLIKQQLGLYVNETMVPQLYLSDLPLAMLLTIWAAETVSRRRRVEVPRAFTAIAAFILWALVTIVQERAPLLGASWLLYEAKLALMFLWFVNARLDRRDLRHALVVLVASLLLQSGVTVYTFAAQTGEDVFGSLFGTVRSTQEARVAPSRGSGAAFVFEQGALRRGTGTVGTANLEAKYFVLLLPLALVAAAAARRPLIRVAACGVVLLGLAALYLTYSRGGLLTALCALGLLPVLLARGGIWNRRQVVMAGVAAVTVLALAAPVLVRFLGSRPGFASTRLDQSRYGVEILLQNPFAGVGINNFNLYASPVAYEGTFNGSPIHNHYLRIAIETGLIGLGLYLVFHLWAMRLAFRLTANGDRFVAATAAGLCAALVGIAVYWVEDLFYDPIIRTQTWITIGLIAALARVAAERGGITPATVAPAGGG